MSDREPLELYGSFQHTEDIVVERSHTAGFWPSVYEPLKKAGEKVAEWFAPRSDAGVAADKYSITIELPGVEPGDIDVQVHEGTLVVRGEKRVEVERQVESYFFSEREYGTFLRSFRLPPDANSEAIEADFRNGILSIVVPKLGQVPGRTRRVSVRTD
jgi:HSP20 family protein